MVKYFKILVDEAPPGEKSTRRALQCWLILIAKAHTHSIITYEELAKLLGYPTPNPLSYILGNIMFYCMQNDLPPLTSIVVNKNTGMPGGGFIAEKPSDIPSKQISVFHFHWFDIIPPTIEDFKESYSQEKNNSQE